MSVECKVRVWTQRSEDVGGGMFCRGFEAEVPVDIWIGPTSLATAIAPISSFVIDSFTQPLRQPISYEPGV
jgi:hypothetical protein